MKKILSQLLVLIPLLLTASIAFAYTAPSGGAPSNNTAIPVNVTSLAQVKNGGLSTGVFQAGNAGSSALLDQQSVFHGMLRGGTPGDPNSSLSFGTSGSKVDIAITGTLAVAGSLQSDSLKAAAGTQNYVCADGRGSFFLCGGTAASVTDNGRDKYIYSTGGDVQAAVDNLGNGNCTPGFTTFALDTGRPITNEIGGFANPRLTIWDAWPNLLSPSASNDPNNIYGYDLSGTADNNGSYYYIPYESRLGPNADVTAYPGTLALTAPQAGTYDISYKSNGHLSMLLDNGKTTKNSTTATMVSFYMVVRHPNGSQDAYPLAPVSDICVSNNYAHDNDDGYATPGFLGAFMVAPGPSDADNTQYHCLGTGGGEFIFGTIIINHDADVYHAERDYALNFSQTLSLQKGDKIYMFGISNGYANKDGGAFSGLNRQLFGVDACKPFKLTVDSKLSIFDVTLHG